MICQPEHLSSTTALCYNVVFVTHFAFIEKLPLFIAPFLIIFPLIEQPHSVLRNVVYTTQGSLMKSDCSNYTGMILG